MFVVFVVIAAVVIFAVVAVSLGNGKLMDDDPPDVTAPELGPEPLYEADLAAVRFAVVMRGYRMDQVDGVLARLGRELTERDERIAQLEAALSQRAGGETGSMLPVRPTHVHKAD